MLAEQVADTGPVAGADQRRIGADVVLDDERRRVFDPGTGTDRTNEVVDLLAGRPWRPGAQSELLVERADGVDDLAAKEDREGDRAVPEVVLREDRAVRLPGCSRVSARVSGQAGQAGQRRIGA